MPCRSQWTTGHRPLDFILCPVLLYCRLHLSPAVAEARCTHLLLQIRFQVFLGRLLPRRHYDVHCNACLAMLSSLYKSPVHTTRVHGPGSVHRALQM